MIKSKSMNFPGSARASRAVCGASPQTPSKFAMAMAPSPAREAGALPDPQGGERAGRALHRDPDPTHLDHGAVLAHGCYVAADAGDHRAAAAACCSRVIALPRQAKVAGLG